MSSLAEKIRKRSRRKGRVRKKIHGTVSRPRVSVYKSHQFLYVQAIDDEQSITLAAASTQKLDFKPNVAGGVALGALLAEELKKTGISAVVFDRNGYKFHGVVKAIADNLRDSGIEV